MRNTLPLPVSAPPPSPPPPPPPENNPPSTPTQETTQTSSSTCEICIEPMESPVQKSKFIKDCDHPFCSECMIKYICAKLDDNISKIPCPALNCNHFFDPFTCQTLVAPQVFVRWCDVLCESSIMEMERSYCPNRNCSTLIVNECGRRRNKKATCPNCKRPFCFQCMLPWHGGLGCEETQEFRERDDIEFGILAKNRRWMRCPKCRHFVERVDGCRIIKCRCQAQFCYSCGADIKLHWCKCRSHVGFVWLLFVILVYSLFTCAFILLPPTQKSGL